MNENLHDAAIEMLMNACHAANKKWWLNLNAPCAICTATNAVDHHCRVCAGNGYMPKSRNVGELLMLCVSELAEAMEGDRKDLMDTKLPHRKMLEVELADCLIRIFDMGRGLKLDLAGAFVEKMAYNAVRADHTITHRLGEGGKKY